MLLTLLALIVPIFLLHRLILSHSSNGQGGARPIPVVHGRIPWIGAYLEMWTDPVALLQRAQKLHGQGPFQVNMLFLKLNFILGPKAQEKLFKAGKESVEFTTPFKAARKKRKGSATTAKLVWTPEVQDFNFGIIAKAFSSIQHLQQYHCFLKEETRQELERWSRIEGGKVNLFPTLSKMMLRVMVRCLLGDEAYHKHADDLANMYYEWAKSMLAPSTMILHSLLPFVPSIKRMEKTQKALLAMIHQDVLASAGGKAGSPDLLSFAQSHINARREDLKAKGLEFDEQQEAEYHATNTLFLLFATHINVEGTLGWCVYHTLADSTIHSRVEEEALEKGANFTSLQSASYMDAIVRETGRMYSVIRQIRKCVADFEWQGSIVPKGELIAVSPYMVHHDPLIYPDPETYDPSRFLPGGPNGDSRALATSFSFMQFGYGQGRCLGDKFTFMAMKTVLVEIFSPESRWELRLEGVDAEVPKPDWRRVMGTPTPKQSVWVSLRERA